MRKPFLSRRTNIVEISSAINTYFENLGESVRYPPVRERARGSQLASNGTFRSSRAAETLAVRGGVCGSGSRVSSYWEASARFSYKYFVGFCSRGFVLRMPAEFILPPLPLGHSSEVASHHCSSRVCDLPLPLSRHFSLIYANPLYPQLYIFMGRAVISNR